MKNDAINLHYTENCSCLCVIFSFHFVMSIEELSVNFESSIIVFHFTNNARDLRGGRYSYIQYSYFVWNTHTSIHSTYAYHTHAYTCRHSRTHSIFTCTHMWRPQIHTSARASHYTHTYTRAHTHVCTYIICTHVRDKRDKMRSVRDEILAVWRQRIFFFLFFSFFNINNVTPLTML